MFRVTRAILFGVILAALLCPALRAEPPEAANGVSYILIPAEIAGHDGVYRLNSYTAPYKPLAEGKRLFDLKFGKAALFDGLAVDQQNNLFLLGASKDSRDYTIVNSVGWIPSEAFDDDSPAWVKLIGQPFDSSQVSIDIDGPMPNQQFESGTTNYDNDFWDYSHLPALPYLPGGSSLRHDAYKLAPEGIKDDAGNTYKFFFDPVSLSAFKGTPLWSGPSNLAIGKRNPKDSTKVLLPNKWGGISFYAVGTTMARADHAGKIMDGKDGRPLMTTHDLRLKHEIPNQAKPPEFSPYWDAKYIAAVFRRMYANRFRKMDLYAFTDEEPPPDKPPFKKFPKIEASQALRATDLKVLDFVTKTSAGADTPGGELTAMVPARIEAKIQVVNSSSGRKYTFNPRGRKNQPFKDADPSLTVVFNGETYPLEFSENTIKNATYFKLAAGTFEKTKRIGVSSKFENSEIVNPTGKDASLSTTDYIFASIADKFAIQDSWWGNGGVAYEYYEKDFTSPAVATLTFKARHIYRLDFVANPVPLPQDLGEFAGAVDEIGVDGQGNLFVLTTELAIANEPAWPAPEGMPKGPNPVPIWPSVEIKSDPNFVKDSPWMRPGIEKPDSEIPEPGQPGDYKDIHFAQNIKKVLRRYPLSAGGQYSLQAKEDWGMVKAGFDTIIRKLRFEGDGKFSWVGDWYHKDPVSERFASREASLAVVNFAARPVVSPAPADCKYSICRDESAGGEKRVGPGAVLAEGDEVTFKVEGYKPYDPNGVRQNLKYVGNLDGLGSTKVNLFPPFENKDEDGDGHPGGFPSSMFETVGNNVKILWNIDLVEGTDPSNSSKVLKQFVKDATPNKGGDFQNFSFKFPHPGNYRVYAKVRYRYFDFAELNPTDGPNRLKEHVKIYPSSTDFVTTRKVLYQVQAATNDPNSGYISKVVLYNQNFNQGVEPVSDSGNIYNLPEGASPNDMKFSFLAQFVRDANRFDPNQPYLTYNGVGVWDYGDASGHVYNYVSANEFNNEYNPGWQKPTDQANLANHGTRVDGPPGKKDLQAIRWKMFLYADYSGSAGPVARLKNKSDTGILVAEGDCSEAEIEAASVDRQFKISVKLPEKAVTFKMPIDPSTYRLRLELIYPRVKWQEFETGKADQPQYRSIVPDDKPLGIVTTVPGKDGKVAYEGHSDNSNVFTGGDSWNVRVRDNRIFQAQVTTDASVDVIQTTGDPVRQVSLDYVLTDNNPNSEFQNFGVRYQKPSAQRDPTQIDDKGLAAGALTQPVTDPPNSPEAFKTDDYRKTAAYHSNIPEYGDSGGNSALFGPGNEFQHWIGSLSFWIEGDMKDGYGVTEPLNLDTPHHYSFNAPEAELKTQMYSLQRFDNDPPTLRMTVVSPSENRRWEVSLEENNTDFDPNPRSIDRLASSVLSIACYRIDKSGPEATLVATQSVEVPGSSNGPTALDSYKDIKFTDIPNLSPEIMSAFPKIRRSGRIMVNVDFDDNVDYLPFTAAGLEILELREAQSPLSLLPPQAIPVSLAPTFTKTNSPNFDLPKPRARFSVDLPMIVKPNQSLPGRPQVVIRLFAKDAAGNERSITLPIQVIDSTFETRILESKESRQ